MIIHIDMDGVMCNYKEGHDIMKKLVPSLKYPQKGIAFWTRLKPIVGAIEAVNKLREVHDVYILSAPSTYNPASYSGKRIWVKEHFDIDLADRLILCNYKGLLRGDVLIDDNRTGKGQESSKVGLCYLVLINFLPGKKYWKYCYEKRLLERSPHSLEK